jgi:hypothetical protein
MEENKIENTEKKKMNKKLILPLMVVFAIGLVVAGVYLVNSLTLTVGVAEPFEVEYAVLGDAGTYTSQSCDGATYFHSTDTSIPTGNLYAGESRYVCVKINNLAEVSIPYTITQSYLNDNANYDCQTAFGNPTPETGTVGIKSTITDGFLVKIDEGATPVAGCVVKIGVTRG